MVPSRLPSLNALRVFETTGRLESVSRAAEALNVSPGAVSRHITLLEDELGGKLFERVSRGLKLTAEGRALLDCVQPSLLMMRQTSERIRQQFKSKRDIVLWSYPTTAMEWLVPRLAAFKRDHPLIELKLQTSLTLSDNVLGSSPIILIAQQDCPRGMSQDILFEEQLIPICSPNFLLACKVRDPHDLLSSSIISTASRHSAWMNWIQTYVGEATELNNFIMLDQSAHAIRLALEGHGIALAAHFWVADALKRGSLVAPFGKRTVKGDTIAISSSHSYSAAESDHGRVVNWLKSEAAKTTTTWESACSRSVNKFAASPRMACRVWASSTPPA